MQEIHYSEDELLRFHADEESEVTVSAVVRRPAGDFMSGPLLTFDPRQSIKLLLMETSS